MSETLIILGVSVAVVSVAVGWTVGIYNTVVVAKNDISGMWADIKTEYQRRVDLLGNLVKSVTSHKAFEKSTLVELTQARSGLGNAKDNNSIKNAISKIENVSMKLQAQFEAYPELKSSALYLDLNENILETENRINQARGELNNMVQDYNTFINMFPTNLMAKNVLGNTEENFWKPAKELNSSYDIKLD